MHAISSIAITKYAEEPSCALQQCNLGERNDRQLHIIYLLVLLAILINNLDRIYNALVTRTTVYVSGLSDDCLSSSEPTLEIRW